MRPVAVGGPIVFRFRIRDNKWATSHAQVASGRVDRVKECVSVVAAAADAGKADIAGKLGIESGSLVQERGWDSDVDEEIRNAVEERCGDDLVDEDSDEVVDVVLLLVARGRR